MIETQNLKTADEIELLHSLGKLARGLSALFWGLPAALIVCAETARIDFLKPVGIIPALVANALLLFGLWQMSSFQKQERPWRNALDHAKLFGFINFCLCPFLFWFNRMPEQFYFQISICILVFSALLFLFNLNIVLKQLGAMLPDETLRQEMRLFTLINRWMLVLWLIFIAIAIVLKISDATARFNPHVSILISRAGLTLFLFFGLSPLAITMALIWKTKEVILDSVFGAK